MPTRLLVLPMRDEHEPDFLGSRPDGYRIKINYRDVAKVFVTGSERMLNGLAEKADEFLHPEPSGEFVDATEGIYDPDRTINEQGVDVAGGMDSETLGRILDRSERQQRGESLVQPPEVLEAERKGELPPGNQAALKDAKSAAKEGK